MNIQSSNTRPSSIFEKVFNKHLIHSEAAGVNHRLQPTIQERFEEFHRNNPLVYDLLVSYAREAKSAGHKRFGIQAVAERVRWEMLIETQDDSGFKLCNAYLSRYARLIMANESDLTGFFRTGQLRSL
jgi:hypothetical protein